MKKSVLLFAALMIIVFSSSGVQAATINLFDYAFNIDGVISEYFKYDPARLPLPSDPIPGNSSGFDSTTGLGNISIDISGVGSHNVIGFFDHEIVESENSYFNELGSATGAAAAGQSWEIDEPGYWAPDNPVGTAGVPYAGDIFMNFENRSLDNRIFYDSVDDQSFEGQNDVSMALGWNFLLAANEVATINFIVSDAAGAGINLIHTDSDSQTSLHYYSTLVISNIGQQPIPEPGTLMLLGSGLAGIAGLGRKKFFES